MSLAEQIRPFLNIYPDATFFIAYSGGVDSHVLLHAVTQLTDQKIIAVHVNHGLHPDADNWQQHCETVCAELGVVCKAVKVHVMKQPRHSLEATARALRYEALLSFMQPHSILFTGHNKNDQVETVLLQLMRGAGVKGLSGMPVQRKWGTGQHVRPLLSVTRSEIEAYAVAHHFSWIEDPSNASDDFDRNFLRHRIIPELVARREGVIENIARSSRHVAEAAALLEELAGIDYQTVQGPDPTLLDIQALKKLSDSRQNNVIRYWLVAQAVQLPSQAIVEQIRQQLLYSYPGAMPLVRWADVELKRIKRDGLNSAFILLTKGMNR